MAPENRQTEIATDGIHDAEFEALLRDAYHAPPIPHSLLDRIDTDITAEWGQSPGLVGRPAHSLALGARKVWTSLRRWSMALTMLLAATVVLLILTMPGNSAWAAMLEAMARQGLIELQTEDGTRWLSLSEGIIGEESPQEVRLLNVKEEVLLTQRTGENQVYRQRLPGARSSMNAESLAVMFFTGLDKFPAEGRSLSSWKFVREVKSGSDMTVHLTCESRPPVDLQLKVNEQTELPLSFAVDVQSPLPLRYGSTTTNVAASRLNGSFPVIDGVPPVAAKVASNAAPQVNSPSVPPTEIALAPVEPVPAAISLAFVNTFEDIPSRWRPVARPEVASRDMLTDLNQVIEKLWAEQQVTPVPVADDAELMRRVYLDLVGRTPTVHEARAYLADKNPQRYEQLVDRLLASPDHASHLATMWRSYLIPDGIDLTAFGGVETFDKWLADQLSGGTGYDEIAKQLLLAEGRLSQSGPLLFYTAAKLDPDQLAARTSRVFLGVRLECAQCHDHPFEPWKQEDFWSMAAFFSRISRPRGKLEAASRVMRVHDIDDGDVMLPDTKTVVPPKFLNSSNPVDEQVATARRQELADWVTSAENPYFARATANRVWGQMFGRGIVDPVDDFGVRNVPISPELLDLLAGHLISSKFQLKELFRTIALSRPYRLSSGAEEVDERRLKCFAQMNVKMLTAEQVYDCISVATLLQGQPAQNSDEFNVVRYGNTDREAFLQQFRTPSGRMVEYQGGIPQALTLMNGSLIQGATGLSSSGLLSSLEAPFFSNQQRIEIVYLATLSRTPRPDEWELLHTYIPANAQGEELQQDLADILWALLNSAEFTMNH